jgi:hypothetical protein
MSIARAPLGVAPALLAAAVMAAEPTNASTPAAPDAPSAAAQPAARAASPRPADVPAAAAVDRRPTAEPRVQRIVDEDEHVRIEELRVRGESQRIVVQPKGSNAKEYEIVPTSGAIDPSLGVRRTARERMWRVLNF